ncbi:MAG: hypothetical protein IKU51_04560 [Clostridia bacterium]|nr:hypothetical protein [Clostridia bacterium]
MLDEKLSMTQTWLKGMIWIGAGVSAAVVVLRLWLLPAVADWQTGMFASNYWVIGFMVAALIALAALRYLAGPFRREIHGPAAVVMAIAALFTGAVLAVMSVLELFRILGGGVVLFDGSEESATSLLSILEHGFGVLGGAALIRFGWALLTEGATRRGIAQWSILAPVLWALVRLVGYEMSYASMVRIEDNFFGFIMLIVELLFLFRLARFASGIGRVSAGSLMGHAMATAIFAISGPVTRVGMYLLQDHQAFAAYQLAGPTDLTIGVFALVVGIALLSGEDIGVQEDSLSEVLDKDAAEAVDVASADLLFNPVADDETAE